MRRVVVVGASIAGLRAASALRQRGFGGELVVVGAERYPPCHRPPLSKGILHGDAIGSTALNVDQAPDVEWLLETRAVGLDADGRHVELADGGALWYDGLVVATGAAPNAPPWAGVGGVHMLRTLDDAIRLRDALVPGRRVVVAGAGLVGCEVASACTAAGLAVDLVFPDATPMLRDVGTAVGGFLARLHAAAGVALHPGRRVVAVRGDDHVDAAVLDDGTTLLADLVVAATGVRPATGWLDGTGVPLRDGVLCDESLRIRDVPAAVACGDVLRWPEPRAGGDLRVEHWMAAIESAEFAVASLLLGSAPTPAYRPSLADWTDQHGVRLQALGLPWRAERMVVLEGRLDAAPFLAVAVREGRVVGAVGADAQGGMQTLRPLVEAEAPLR